MSRQFLTFSRQILTLPLALLAALLCLGALAAQPARAGITIDNITGVPNPVPATGGTAPVLISCSNTTGVPTGTATLTNSSGAIVNQNPVNYYQADADGNPIVYVYVVFPVDHSLTSSITYTLNITVQDQAGTSASRSMSVLQGSAVPILINSITPSPSVLPATANSVSVSVNMTDNAPNMAGYFKGEADLFNSAGQTLDIEPLWGSAPTVTTTVRNIPANTTGTAQTYTLSIMLQDNNGVRSYASLSLTQQAASVTIPPAATSLSAASVTGILGQAVALSATLTSAGAGVSGRLVNFAVDGAAVGSSTTNGSGMALYPYTLLSSLSVGSHTVTASFGGDTSYAASTGTATLTANPFVTVGTTMTIENRTVTHGENFHLVGRLRRASDGAFLSGETVTVSLDGTVLGTVTTGSTGLASLSYKVPSTLSLGNHTISVSFAGDSTYAASSRSGTLTVTN